jgi:hypothetical protein
MLKLELELRGSWLLKWERGGGVSRTRLLACSRTCRQKPKLSRTKHIVLRVCCDLHIACNQSISTSTSYIKTDTNLPSHICCFCYNSRIRITNQPVARQPGIFQTCTLSLRESSVTSRSNLVIHCSASWLQRQEQLSTPH